MATITTEIHGMEDIGFTIPNTVSEIISLVGEDRVMELVVNGAMASNANKIKTAFVKAVEEKTGEKRKANAEGRITETGLGYIERMRNTIPDFDAQFRPVMEKLASEHTFSFSRERAAVAEVKVPKKYVDSVKYMHATVDIEGNPKEQTLERNLAKYAPDFDFSSILDGENLTEDGAVEAAKLLRAPLEAREKQLAAMRAAI